MAYLNVEEIEAAVQTLSQTYSATSELIVLPHQTVEGRTCHALRIGAGPAGGLPGVVLVGGVHAREWVPPDLCVSFAADVLEAYELGTGLGYGNTSFVADEIRSIVENLNLFVFPAANPDGRVHSQSIDAMWRRNRNPAQSGGNPGCIGVDINRNFDFLWDFERRFSPDALVSTSADSCSASQTYRGPAPLSEVESRNIVHLLDAQAGIRWFVDLHSYGELILYSWGDDQNQSHDPQMAFTNTAFDSARGVEDDEAYREYIPGRDLEHVRTLAECMQAAIEAVRGRRYSAGQAFSLYATSGASDDYAFSRHLTDASRAKVYGFTVECGTEFQPTWAEAEHIIIEVSAGLLTFCLQALQHDRVD